MSEPIPDSVITEVWAPLPGWPHEVSDHGGRIRSPHGRILAQSDSNRPVDGPPFYQLVTLVAGGRRKTCTVHSLVLMAHRPHRDADGNVIGDGRPPGLEASHLDDVPDHNDLDNLVWEDHPSNEMRKVAAVRSAAARKARAAQDEQGIAKPPPRTFRCRNHARCGGMVAKDGSRCGPCAVQVGLDAAVLLRLGMPAQAVGEFFGHTSGGWVFDMAVKHGGYTGSAAGARTQRPTLGQRVRLMRVKRQIKRRVR